MGECGCSATSPEYRLSGPDGVHYGIEIYPGCQYCSTPAGVVIYRFDDDEAEVWLLGASEPTFHTYQGINGEAAIPVLEAKHLSAALGEWREEDDVDADIRTEEIQQAMPRAVWETLNEWARMVAPAREKD